MEREASHTDIADRHQGGCFPAPPILMTDEQQDYQADRIYDKRCIDFWCDMDNQNTMEEVTETENNELRKRQERYYRELNLRANKELNKKTWV